MLCIFQVKEQAVFPKVTQRGKGRDGARRGAQPWHGLRATVLRRGPAPTPVAGVGPASERVVTAPRAPPTIPGAGARAPTLETQTSGILAAGSGASLVSDSAIVFVSAGRRGDRRPDVAAAVPPRAHRGRGGTRCRSWGPQAGATAARSPSQRPRGQRRGPWDAQKPPDAATPL